jgi:dTDP-4-dehydrorhamnose reductase
MKILVLGATGMAGHTIALYLLEKGHNVVSYSRSPNLYSNSIIGDVFDIYKFKAVLLDGEYDAIVNCIGILNQSAEDNHADAVYLNSYLPHFIAETLKYTKTKLIHMSTDCIFAGNSGPYYETSFPDGRTFYDRTKALGEVDDQKNLTFRNSIIGPDMSINGIGLFNWFMKQTGSINGYTGAIWTGVTTITLAKAIENAIEFNLTGIYNLVNNKSISKYDLLLLFNSYRKNNKISINMDYNYQLDKSLLSKRNDFQFKVPSYDEMIFEMFEWISNYSHLYPHYKL